MAICAGSYPEEQARRNAAESLSGYDSARGRPREVSPPDSVERGEARASSRSPRRSFSIASYSRLVPRKGMDTLIRASALWRRATPTFAW